MNTAWREQCDTCRPPTAAITDQHGRRWELTLRHLDGLVAYEGWLRHAPGYVLDDDLAARHTRATGQAAPPVTPALAA